MSRDGPHKKSCNNITLVSDRDFIPATRNHRAVVKLALIHSGESGHVMWCNFDHIRGETIPCRNHRKPTWILLV